MDGFAQAFDSKTNLPFPAPTNKSWETKVNAKTRVGKTSGEIGEGALDMPPKQRPSKTTLKEGAKKRWRIFLSPSPRKLL